MLTLQSVCRVVRRREPNVIYCTPPLSGLKMSAINDAVSKALTGKPYSQAVAAERDGLLGPLQLPAPHLVEVSSEYGLDRREFAGAISRAFWELDRRQDETFEERFRDRYIPFPEHEATLRKLEAHLAQPINGVHVAMVGDYCTGLTTIFRHFRFLNQPDAWELRAPDYFGRFVIPNPGGYGTRLERWTQSLYLGMANFDWMDPAVFEMEHLRGKLALREGLRLAAVNGVDTIFLDDFSGPFRSEYGKGRNRFGKAVSAFADAYPFRLVMAVSPDMRAFRACAPALYERTAIIKVPPLSDSPVLRSWIATTDARKGRPMLGEYDDEMVSAILAVSRGVTLLISRYVGTASMAMEHSGWTRKELRERLIHLGDIARSQPDVELSAQAVDNFLDGKES